MKNRLICLLLVLLNYVGFSQTLLDSLKNNCLTADDDSSKAYWLKELSAAYSLSNHDSALYYNSLGLQLAAGKDWKNLWGELKYTRVTIFDESGYFDSALFLLDELLESNEYLPDKLADIYNFKGVIYRSKGELEKSLENFLMALELYRSNHDPREVRTYASLALLYNYMNDYPKALEFGWKGKHLVERYDTLPGFGIYNNLGVVHMGLKNYDSAIYYYDKDYTEGNYGPDSERHGIYYHNIAYLLETQGFKKRGVDKFKEALTYKLKNNSTYSKTLTYHAMAEAYYDWHLWGDKEGYKLNTALDSAFKYCVKAKELAEKGNDIRMLMKTNGQISDIYAAKGDPLKYYEYKNEFMHYKDSLFNQDRAKAVAEMDAKYQVKEREAENLKLSNDNLEREATIRRQRYLFLVATIIIFFIGGILLIVYRNHQKVKALNAQVEASNRTKDKLFSIISHDLRGPISAFETIPKILKSYINKQQPEKLEAMIDHIDRSARNINQLLDNLLNWSISQREELVITIERLEIKPILDEIIGVFKDAADLKQITIESTITDQHIMADKNTFATIVRNLLSNAIKFSHPGSKITISHRVSENFVEFTFSDQGTGMSPDQVEKLFNIDKSKVRSGTAKEKGTGLGMVLVKEFVEINKGEIRVESELDRGTTFYISLPLAS